MARKPRIHLPGGFYHIILRGTEASRSFLPDEDRYRFYLLLQAGFAVSAIPVLRRIPLDQP